MLVEVEMRANDWLVEEFPERCVNRKVGYLEEGIRYVEIPEKDVFSKKAFDRELSIRYMMLNSVWYYGQNDFQPSSTQRSLMVGDVVRLYGRRFKVDNFGFSEVK